MPEVADLINRGLGLQEVPIAVPLLQVPQLNAREQAKLQIKLQVKLQVKLQARLEVKRVVRLQARWAVTVTALPTP